MSRTTRIPLAAVIGSTFAVSLAASPVESGGGNPFRIVEHAGGYMVAGDAEGRCGGEKAGEGKCGSEKAGEGKCGSEKAGEGKCGGEKGAEGTCGEGKCGGHM